MRKQNTCCFSGHRRLPYNKVESIIKKLDQEIDRLIGQGITDFLSGGALGFDLIAASLVIAKKEMGMPIRLVFALPCRDQDIRWGQEQRKLYHELLQEADEIIYVSESYQDGCMKKRNRFMVDHASHCVCALLRPQSGTGQTVRYAMQKGLRVVNVAG